MLIGELSKQTGLSKDTIRFYEKNGLIRSGDRKAGSRLYREYSAEVVERLAMIRQGKALGFTLNEIRELTTAWESGAMPRHEQVRVIQDKLTEVRQKMTRLREMEAYLAEKLSKLEAKS
ncbi:MAG: MerR family DNA-binding protein [Cyanobacteria bacterium J06623_4]